MDTSTLVIILFVLLAIAIIYAFSGRDERTIKKLESGQIKVEGTLTSDKVAPAAPQQPSVKGRIFGTIGMVYMACYALYINSVISGAEVNNLGEAIGKAAAINMFGPFFYIVLAAALLSLVGVIGKNKTCILLALAATIGAVFILPGAFEMLLIPAVLFLISYIRMAKY